MKAPPPPAPPSTRDLVRYFLRLGAAGFGGPIGLANAMRRDLVERRRWLTETEYEQGLAIAAACPGPLAYQLGVYCGYRRRGLTGALAVAVAFALPPFLLVLLAAWLYTRFSASWPLRALFYGVGPVVVALILRACWNLGRRTLGSDARAWAIFLVACGITVALEREVTLIFVAAGLAGIVLFAPRAAPGRPGGATLALAAPSLLGAAGAAGAGMTGKLFLFFFRTGLLVFGSGLVIVPFLKTYVVDQYHWIGNREFLDSVAIGMISPGPVVISATFVGYLLDGAVGAVAASVGIFAPAVLFTVVATPILLRHAASARLGAFIRGVTVAVVGVLVGTTYLVAKTAIGDAATVLVAAGSLAAFAVWKRLPEPAVIAAGAAIGLVVYPWIRPDWMLR